MIRWKIIIVIAVYLVNERKICNNSKLFTINYDNKETYFTTAYQVRV